MSSLFLISLFSLLISKFQVEATDDVPVFLLQPDNTFSRGHLYYRLLKLDEESSSIYVGAMNHLFRLWMFNVNDTENRAFFAEKEWQPTPEALARCAYRSRNPNFQCQNHVRVVFRLVDNSLYTCATNAFDPVVNKLDSATLTVLEGDIKGAAICSVDPDDNSTAIWVEKGNPSNIPSVYSGTVTDFTQTNRIIYRPALKSPSQEVIHPFMRTMHTDSKWLNEPNFVGSFDIGNYVYFFFRESAVEFVNCGKAVYSRVARICKKDVGGRQVLKQNWATFLKSRLNCSLTGEFPFYFDQIQDVYKIETSGDTLFYATFTTNLNGFYGSAVCSFSLRRIDQVFDRGLFKEQISSTAAWLPVLSDQVPKPRPGQCVGDTKQLSDSALHFVKSHLLMDEAVEMFGNQPIFSKRDLILTKLAVDVISSQHGSYRIIFAGSTKGHMYKILQWTDSKGIEQSRLLTIYRLPKPEPIRAIELLKNEFLYVAQDSQITQMNPSQCNRYQRCSTCTGDPYCSWNTAEQRCHRAHESHMFNIGWITSRPDLEKSSSKCDLKPTKETYILYPGDSIHLKCRHELSRSKSVNRWLKNNSTLFTGTGRHFVTVDGGLIIVNISGEDSGHYECMVLGQITVNHQVFVDDVNCKKPQNVRAFQTAYKEWCREFQNYKQTMDKWQQWYEQNTHCANAPNFKKLPRGGSEAGKKTNRIIDEKR